VGVDGRLYACPLFAGTGTRLPRRWAAAVRDAAVWGFPDEPELEDRRRRSGAALGALAPFAAQTHKRSSRHRCATCPARSTCRICPYAILWLAGDDPLRVPDFPCAFHRHAALARSRMPVEPLPSALSAHPAVIEQRMRTWLAGVARRRRPGA
jgi:hypothetical protein